MQVILNKLNYKVRCFYYSKIKKNYDVLEKIKIEPLIKKGLKVGDNTDLFNNNIDSFFPYLIEIGKDCTITNSTILAHDASTKKQLGKSKIGKVKIGNNVFVGYGSIILPNVTIGDNVIIGAGSVVSRDVASNSVVAGVPIKFICTYEEYLQKNKILMQIRPVFSTTYNKDITKEEIQIMNNKLTDGIGFND